MAIAMTRTQHKSPLSAYAFTAMVTATALLWVTVPAPVFGQGVWAEPACGMEPVCGAEPVRGLEPRCGAEPACGCGSSHGGELLGCEKGLLSQSRLSQVGPIYVALDTVAGGIQRLLSHRCPAQKSTRGCCECSTCSRSLTQSRRTYSNHQPILMSPPSSLPPAPHIHAAPQVAPQAAPPPPLDEQRTTIRHNAPQPLTTPPVPKPRPLRDAEPSRPGRAFDELTDPFKDDSASHTARRGQSILQATFARNDSARSQSDSQSRSQSEQEADDYRDYFRD